MIPIVVHYFYSQYVVFPHNLFNHSLVVDIYVGSIFDHYELNFYEYLSTNYFVIICFQFSLKLQSYLLTMFNHLRNCQNIFLSVYTSSIQSFQFLLILTNTGYFLSFEYRHSSGCHVVSHYGLDLHCPNG